MRLVTFTTKNTTSERSSEQSPEQSSEQPRLGALINDDKHIVDFTGVKLEGCDQPPPALQSMLALIEQGDTGLSLARDVIANASEQSWLNTADCQLLSPLPRPTQLRCFSAFEQHARQSAQAMMQVMAAQTDDPNTALEEMRNSGKFDVPPVFYERPLYYKGNRLSVVGTGVDIAWPAYSSVVDFELELAAVIGRAGRDISAVNAGSHIFGYAVFNDLTARDEQAREMVAPLGPAKGKDFDGGNILGPCIVTADELANPYNLGMSAKVNEEMWCDNSSAGMAHSFEDMIAYVSRSETLYPGEVFLSGCVGSGSGMEQGRYPQRGDTIALAIEHIGCISNRIV